MIFDASCLLNLSHGSILRLVATRLNLSLKFGPLVYAECPTVHAELDELVASCDAVFLSDDDLPASIYVGFLEKYRLGAGETECLALASRTDDVIACDDAQARSVIETEFGRQRLTGTIGLLLRAGHQRLLTPTQVREAHRIMREQGGFLPDL